VTELGATDVSRSAGSLTPAGWQPHIVALVCNWCSYAGADMAGTTRLKYPANVRLVRFPCTGRMSPLMIVKAFERGADGVLVSGCHPGDCHYVQGNLVARRRFTVFRSLMDFLGVDLRRLHFAWVSAAEGNKWAQVVKQVTESVREAGPLPRFEGNDAAAATELPPLVGTRSSEMSPTDAEALVGHLRRAAADLLATERVGTVIGYRRGSLPDRSVPMMAISADEAEQLVWDDGCLCNLATYLPASLERHERVAIVVKDCDLGAVAGLIREGQVRRDQLVVIGVQCPGVRHQGDSAAKCLTCEGLVGDFCDLVVTPEEVLEGSANPPVDPAGDDPRDEQVAYLESLPADQRWRFWQRQFARCLRPQWVSPVIDNRGNSAWNIIRAVHLAGRCTGCDECARVCPSNIRLDLINRKLALEVERQYGSAGLDPETLSALTQFRMEDAEEFIL
jgi:coenzyme F420-reducing hydrogenase delta subunit/ferredoxin